MVLYYIVCEISVCYGLMLETDLIAKIGQNAWCNSAGRYRYNILHSVVGTLCVWRTLTRGGMCIEEDEDKSETYLFFVS